MNIIERLSMNGWIKECYDVDEIVDVGSALLCFKGNSIIGVYTDMYARVDGISITDKKILLYYKGEFVREIKK